MPPSKASLSPQANGPSQPFAAFILSASEGCDAGAFSSVTTLAILDRAYGKAPTFSSTDTTQFKRAIDMTDDELAAIASRVTLHVVK